MMGKLFYFLFAFLFFLISLARSEIEPNPQLELNIKCSTNNPCSSKGANCNSVGKCQCGFSYIPEGNTCVIYKFCGSPDYLSCSQLYKDPYARCIGLCSCFPGFRLNEYTQKCELENPNANPLGGSCVTDNQCGKYVKCTTAGKCRCKAGWIPETEFTCTQSGCPSTEFCHVNVTANTVCKSGICECPRPNFKQDPDTFECVRVLPDTLPLGANCKNSTYCGEGARCTTGSEPICKCKLGYLATSDTGCEQIKCSKDENCHSRISPLTFCAIWNSNNDWGNCWCEDGYYEDPATHECSPYADNTPPEDPPEDPIEVPTEAPTEAPTGAPTGAPTEASTDSPTEVPTNVPIENPTGAPTEDPTDDPTGDPTEDPTEGPTENPTEAPTEAPTDVSTEAPTITSTEASDIGESCGREKLYKSLWLKCEMRRPSCTGGSIDLQLKVKGYGSSKDPHSSEVSPYEQIQ